MESIKSFKYNTKNWRGINYLSKIDDWRMFEKNNPTIALNILYIKEKEICPAYISKVNSKIEKQRNLLMFPNEERRMASYCSNKIIRITSNNLKT